jgi:hypothetical protein
LTDVNGDSPVIQLKVH